MKSRMFSTGASLIFSENTWICNESCFAENIECNLKNWDDKWNKKTHSLVGSRNFW